jgi:hypothetical protein
MVYHIRPASSPGKAPSSKEDVGGISAAAHSPALPRFTPRILTADGQMPDIHDGAADD